MPDDKIPSYQDIARTKRIFGRHIPGLVEEMEGERLDAKERADLLERKQKKHNDKMSFRITLVSTIVAVIAALAALWGGYEAHQTRVEDERPYVKFQVGTTHEDFPFEVISFGKTPAVNVKTICVTAWNPPLSWKKFPNEQESRSDIAFIMPAQKERANCFFGPAVGDNAHYFYGVITYQDLEDRMYRTPFCYFTTDTFPVKLNAPINSCDPQLMDGAPRMM